MNDEFVDGLEKMVDDAPTGATEIWMGLTDTTVHYAKLTHSGEWVLWDNDNDEWHDSSIVDVLWSKRRAIKDIITIVDKHKEIEELRKCLSDVIYRRDYQKG
jgi:hypothetical protein